jgi:hypothetical protein
MVLLPTHPHLHRDTSERLTFGQTHAGMAAPANTGPPGTFCSMCRYWGFHAKQRASNCAPCLKFKQLTMGVTGKPVPGGVKSCKFFLHLGAPGPQTGSSS